MSPLIEVLNARCRIGRRGVLCVDELAIGAGEHWCLFGPNGAGKTLLANLVAGRRVETGHYVHYAENFDPAHDCLLVSFEEQQRLWQRDNRLDISDYSADARDVGTSVRALVYGARYRAEQNEADYKALIEQLDLAPLQERGIRFLSSGQVRRALLARALYGALASPARLLILDDPLESIDRGSRERISACIEQQRRRGFASLHLCRRGADIPAGITHMALLQGLSVVAQGRADEIRGGEAFRLLQAQKPTLPARLPYLPETAVGDGRVLVELRDVEAHYGPQKVLSALNWSMRDDEHVLIEGPNGCGKSTLLSLIDGDNHKGYGQHVILFGQRKGGGESVWEIKSRFGVVSNELHNKYIKGWRVPDVVVSGFFDSVGLYDDSGAREKEQARQWLTALGLKSLSRHYYEELSFGQQRLVLLARAMVKQPRILVLDEPCVGLDDYHRRLILALVDRIAQELPTRIIYVSHEAGEQPACITTRYRFDPVAGGGSTLIRAG